MNTIKDFIFITGLFVFIAFYVLSIAWASQYISDQHFLVELIFYIICGFLWIFPAKLFLKHIGGRAKR